MIDRFSDRLNSGTYSEEEAVGFGLAQAGTSPDADALVMVPETLVVRLGLIASAYGLHHLPMIDVHGETRFNHIQRQNLGMELEFISNVVRDPALLAIMVNLRRLVEDGRDWDLVVSGP